MNSEREELFFPPRRYNQYELLKANHCPIFLEFKIYYNCIHSTNEKVCIKSNCGYKKYLKKEK